MRTLFTFRRDRNVYNNRTQICLFLYVVNFVYLLKRRLRQSIITLLDDNEIG